MLLSVKPTELLIVDRVLAIFILRWLLVFQIALYTSLKF